MPLRRQAGFLVLALCSMHRCQNEIRAYTRLCSQPGQHQLRRSRGSLQVQFNACLITAGTMIVLFNLELAASVAKDSGQTALSSVAEKLAKPAHAMLS